MRVLRNAALEQIEKYPFTQVREKLLKKGELAPEAIDEAVREFRKYLALIALGHKNVGMMSASVDEVWHTFILFTRDYMSFCEEVFGHYLHHQPSLPSQPLGDGPRQLFVEAYRSEFGEPPPIWDRALSAEGPTDGCCGEDCSPEPSCSGEPPPTVRHIVKPHIDGLTSEAGLMSRYTAFDDLSDIHNHRGW